MSPFEYMNSSSLEQRRDELQRELARVTREIDRRQTDAWRWHQLDRHNALAADDAARRPTLAERF